MKTYNIETKIKHTTLGIEAENEEQAREIIKLQFLEDFYIDIDDDEITRVEEVKEE